MYERKKKILLFPILILWIILISIGIYSFLNNLSSNQEEQSSTSHLYFNLNEIILDESNIDKAYELDEIKTINYSNNVLVVETYVGKDVIVIINFFIDNDIIIYDSEEEVIEFFVDEQLIELFNDTLLMTEENMTIDVITRGRQLVNLEINLVLSEEITSDNENFTSSVLEGSNILDILFEMVAQSNIQRVGYTIVGFYDSELNLVTSETIIPSNGMQVTIKWQAKYHNVTLDFNGGYIEGFDESTVEFTLEKEINLYEYIEKMDLYLVKSGYEFVGWTLNGQSFTANYMNDFDLEIDITLVAEWEIEFYNVTLDFNGGYIEGSDESTMEFILQKGINLYEYIEKMDLDLVKSGYQFVEWTLNGKSFTVNYMNDFEIGNEIILVAKWEGSGSITITGGSSMFLNEDASGSIIASNDMILRDLVLGTNIVTALIDFLEAINGVTGLPIENYGHYSARIYNGHAVRVMSNQQIIGFSINGDDVNFLHDSKFLNWVLDDDAPTAIVSAIVLTNITNITWDTTDVTLNTPTGNSVTGVRISSRNDVMSGDIIMPSFIDGKRVISLEANALGVNLRSIDNITLPKYLIEANPLVSTRENIGNVTIDLTNMPWLETIPENFARTGASGESDNVYTLLFNPISGLTTIEQGSFRTGQHHRITINIQLWNFDETNFSGNIDTTWWAQRNNFGLPTDTAHIQHSIVNPTFGETGNRVTGW